MADIFISYKREEQEHARQLADALEGQGWSVWWDPKLRAGERFDDVIEAALTAANCVIVMWSQRSVKSTYVKDEATYALKRNKLVPVAIEEVDLPFRFEGIHTPRLCGWSGDTTTPEFRKLIADLTEVAGEPTSPSRAPGTVYRDRLKDGGEGPEMVVIPAGSFMMGSREDEADRDDAESPQHEVIIAQPFALGKYPVTFDEYDRFCEATLGLLRRPMKPNDMGWGRGNLPVINVRWEDAVAYCEWLSNETGKRYRLPSEDEWEYAARAGTTTRYYWGDDPGTNRANFRGSVSRWDGSKTAPVGSFEPNAWGLYDMLGNVWEWVQDCWHGSYGGAPDDGSAWGKEAGEDCDLRVVRGGSWIGSPEAARSAVRGRRHPDDRSRVRGFRVVCSSPIR